MQASGHDGEDDAGPPHRHERPGLLDGEAAEPHPRNAPTWWLRKTIPKSVPRYLVPNITATSPEVSGTVESHRTPIAAAKTSTTAGVGGSVMKTAMTTALAR